MDPLPRVVQRRVGSDSLARRHTTPAGHVLATSSLDVSGRRLSQENFGTSPQKLFPVHKLGSLLGFLPGTPDESRGQEPAVQESEPWSGVALSVAKRPELTTRDAHGSTVVRRKMSLMDWQGPPSIEDDAAAAHGYRNRADSKVRSITLAEAEVKELSARDFFLDAERSNLLRRTKEDTDVLLRDARQRRERLRSSSQSPEVTPVILKTVAQMVEEANCPPRQRAASISGLARNSKGLAAAACTLTKGGDRFAELAATATAVKKAETSFRVQVGKGNFVEKLRAKRRHTIQ